MVYTSGKKALLHDGKKGNITKFVSNVNDVGISMSRIIMINNKNLFQLPLQPDDYGNIFIICNKWISLNKLNNFSFELNKQII